MSFIFGQNDDGGSSRGILCYYAGKAFGRWARFGSAWNYWSTKILIMGSQLTALSILTKFWFPDIPLWIFAAIYAVLSIAVVLLGTKGFDKVENVLAVIKTAAILMFILLSTAALMGWIRGAAMVDPDFPIRLDKCSLADFPHSGPRSYMLSMPMGVSKPLV